MEGKDQLKFDNIIRLLQVETKFLMTKGHNKAEHDMVVGLNPFSQEEIELLKNEALKLLNIK